MKWGVTEVYRLPSPLFSEFDKVHSSVQQVFQTSVLPSFVVDMVLTLNRPDRLLDSVFPSSFCQLAVASFVGLAIDSYVDHQEWHPGFQVEHQ